MWRRRSWVSGCGQLEWVVEVREVRGVYRVVGEGSGR